MPGRFQRTVQNVLKLSKVRLINWVNERVLLLARFIKLGDAGKHTRSQLIQMFTRFMLAIAQYLPDDCQFIITAALIRAQNFHAPLTSR